MKLNVKLPHKLEEKYLEIDSKFEKVVGDWEKYNDHIIPEDQDYAKEIINFLIDFVNYFYDDFENLDVKLYQDFLAFYPWNFLYGPHGDDKNYLNFDEGPLSGYFWDLQDEDYLLKKDKLKELRQKLVNLLKEF